VPGIVKVAAFWNPNDRRSILADGDTKRSPRLSEPRLEDGQGNRI
jgi:hypothetical protein